MGGAILGALQLGAAALAGVPAPPVPIAFNPAWAINVNAFITVRRIES